MIVSIDVDQTRFLEFEKAGSKMLCAVDFIFHLLCAFNCLQPISRVALGTRMNISGNCFAMVTYKGPETKSPLTRLKCPFIVFA